MFNIDSLSLKEKLLFTTVRLVVKKDNKTSAGTSFIFHYRREDKVYPFLITNKHIVENSKEGKLIFRGRKDRLMDPKSPILFNITDFEQMWYYNKESDMDLAIMPFVLVSRELKKNEKKTFHLPLEQSLIPNEKTTKENIDAIEEVIFIGYPNNIYDRKNYLPIVRKGITATPIYVDFNNSPIFLIDASVFPGSSGSPVFLADFGGYSHKSGSFVIGSRLYFLGVLSKGFRTSSSDILNFKENCISNSVPQSEMVDLGAVIKAKAIVDLIEDYLNETDKLKKKDI